MTQLSLFDQPLEFPFEKMPNKKQQAIINDIFYGAQYISKFLGDIIDLYPYQQHVWSGDRENVFLTIGASGRKPNYFYMLNIETMAIYLLHNFSCFPHIESYKN